MKSFSTADLKSLNKIFRLNLINSCTGLKSANLIVTLGQKNLNVAVFSSVVHLGSDPAMLGFVLRPTTVPRDTYKNILENQYFTVNHITKSMVEDAHHTSAKYPEEVSEFDYTNLKPQFVEGHKVPFVQDSPVQLYCEYSNSYPIKENNTLFIVANILNIRVNSQILQANGLLNLPAADVVAINGLSAYAETTLYKELDYQRPKPLLYES